MTNLPPLRYEEAFPKMQAEAEAVKKSAPPSASSGVPSQDDQLRIRIVELATALDWPPSKLQVRAKKLTGEMDIDKMGFEDLGKVAQMLVEEQAKTVKA